MLYSLLAITPAPLQRVLHAAVRLVPNLGYRDHMTTPMKEFYWQTIAYRIKYKLCFGINNRSPAYTHPDIVSTSPSAASFTRVRRFLSTPCADRVWKKNFSIACPTVWNELPHNIQRTDNVTTFKRVLKAHLFTLAYDC